MFDAEFVARFEAKVTKGAGCWEWSASLAGKGYGQMKLPKQRKQEYSHRLAYMIWKGDIPKGIQVCHTCDNPKCCNPDHLFLGSSHDNHQDMKQKGRGTHGVKNARVKLSEADVVTARALLASGVSQRVIAQVLGVHQVSISRINTGARWAQLK